MKLFVLTYVNPNSTMVMVAGFDRAGFSSEGAMVARMRKVAEVDMLRRGKEAGTEDGQVLANRVPSKLELSCHPTLLTVFPVHDSGELYFAHEVPAFYSGTSSPDMMR